MSERNTVWLAPPFGQGEPKEFEANAEALIPAMVAGWAQCEPPARSEEVNQNVDD